jgi:hypothetical protein
MTTGASSEVVWPFRDTEFGFEYSGRRMMVADRTVSAAGEGELEEADGRNCGRSLWKRCSESRTSPPIRIPKATRSAPAAAARA